jgi:conjugative relaxase-like TrwC/TraI family protein
MMSLSAVGGGSDAAGYYQKDNYYTRDEATEASGWNGKAADELDLKGQVDEKVFADVLDGKLPNGVEIKNAKGEHSAGWDITLSASKSVSMVALIGDDERLKQAMLESVEATMEWVEKNLIETRVWDKEAGKQVTVKSDNALIASFTHDVNRNLEPQLHVHNVVANATLAPDGKWHAIRSEAFYDNQHLIGAIHSADYRARVEALGFETEPSKHAIDGNFEIYGVTRDDIERYSSRLDEINEHVAENGFNSPQARQLAALATRKPKDPNISKADVVANWHNTAKEIGFDPKPLIAASIARAAAQQTVWTRAAEGLRTAGAAGMAFAARMGLTPKDGDPLVPERLGRLDPKSYSTAQAVASAVRELGEREAAFSRNDVLLHALQHYGPFTVSDVEARLDLLVDKKLLISGERLMTPQGAIALEHRVIAAAREGNGKVEPIASGTDLASRLQVAAGEQGIRRLNEGQVNAGTDVLSSTNRVHMVQGGAGVGKSVSLGPVAVIARELGHQVIALSHVNTQTREFGVKVGEQGRTVDSFLGQHRSILNGTTKPDRIEAARQLLSGSVIMVDEASQIGTERCGKLVDLANRFDAARLIFAGDTGQLPSMDAGKPHEDLQTVGQATSQVTESLRFKSEQTIALNQALKNGDIGHAFEILEPDTVIVERAQIASSAASLWANLEKTERDQTLLLASGRAMRAEGNAAAQEELRARGEIGPNGVMVIVLDRVTITREGARQLRGYQEGRVVEFNANLKQQGFARGERGTVLDVNKGKVELQMKDGELRLFDPSRLARNLSHDAVSIFEEKKIPLLEGDRIRWTATDASRDFRNGDISHIREAIPGALTVETRDGELHRLEPDDKMIDRLDLAYAVNVHVAQGITAKAGIMMMSAQEKLLNSTQTFLVAVTRFAEKVSLVTDDPSRVQRDVASNPGGKTSAIEETQGFAEVKQPTAPGASSEHQTTQPTPEPSRDFGTGQDQPQIEIERSRDFDIS